MTTICDSNSHAVVDASEDMVNAVVYTRKCAVDPIRGDYQTVKEMWLGSPYCLLACFARCSQFGNLEMFVQACTILPTEQSAASFSDGGCTPITDHCEVKVPKSWAQQCFALLDTKTKYESEKKLFEGACIRVSSVRDVLVPESYLKQAEEDRHVEEVQNIDKRLQELCSKMEQEKSHPTFHLSGSYVALNGSGEVIAFGTARGQVSRAARESSHGKYFYIHRVGSLPEIH